MKQAQADEEVARKIEALRAQQKLEMSGLVLRIERNRAEHRCDRQCEWDPFVNWAVFWVLRRSFG